MGQTLASWEIQGVPVCWSHVLLAGNWLSCLPGGWFLLLEGKNRVAGVQGLFILVYLLFLAAIEFDYILSFRVRTYTASLAPGWSSLMFMLLLVGGILMLGVGFIGVYVGYIFQEVKRRPLYLMQKRRENPSDQAKNDGEQDDTVTERQAVPNPRPR
jgi:hypothetical protein